MSPSLYVVEALQYCKFCIAVYCFSCEINVFSTRHKKKKSEKNAVL